MSMQSSILSVLRMWPNGQTKSEILTGMYLASIGYPKLRNISHLGGRDGGRDLESLDGEHYVACYFPMQEQMNFESIKDKFKSDLEKAKRNRASGFTFFTGQIIQNHQKENLKKFSGDIEVRIISGDEIAAHVCRVENSALRAELGFVERAQTSPDEVFSRNLFSRVNFESLIKAISESIPPNTFSGYFLGFLMILKILDRPPSPPCCRRS
ncbi:hypothetical protein QOT74_14045 [Pseudomonas aeruginosa]|uniref:hypothetical protein n=1 Tax=Pseudomonas aeruginosa TaxID=287 RepID=UPI000AFA822A|nr:hypothetical protein [Pseudomonas aeruginosa]AXL70883.1 hypothetical protein Y31_2930 [Pseudomonas aeruginosa]MCO4016182.1 hypothetical protein [Pseudomonas aeruginosa]HCF3627187.1 hypothetical protein [Pseudomonas aeruginosa]HEJ3806997.1 hypothetical protein [Pseudomonas aeruginosa]HEK0346101.1 hypothetical protein [Pseudomonas aeruginosa]